MRKCSPTKGALEDKPELIRLRYAFPPLVHDGLFLAGLSTLRIRRVLLRVSGPQNQGEVEVQEEAEAEAEVEAGEEVLRICCVGRALPHH